MLASIFNVFNVCECAGGVSLN